jgi:hypothetical protein
LIALEPEAASIYCQYLPTEKLKGAERGFSMSEEGTQYMVVDNGGKYIDVIYMYIYSVDIVSNKDYIASPLLIYISYRYHHSMIPNILCTDISYLIERGNSTKTSQYR